MRFSTPFLFLIISTIVYLMSSCEVSDTTPPTINLIEPTDGSIVYEIVPIRVNATDNETIDRVEFYVGADLLGDVKSPPYTFFWNTTAIEDGAIRTLQCRAFDDSENEAISPSITVTVNNEGRSPDPVQLLIQSVVNKYSVEIVWERSKDLDFDKYIIQKADSIPSEDFYSCISWNEWPEYYFDPNCVNHWSDVFQVQERVDTTYIDTMVNLSNHYVYRIVVQDSALLNSESNVRYFNTKGVEDITISEVTVNPDYTLLINWAESHENDFKKYELYRRSDSSNLELLYSTTDQLATTFLDDTAIEFVTYFYFIRQSDSRNNFSDGPEYSRSVHISPAILSVPSTHFPTIQSALNAAEPTDIVQVSDGTYYENLLFSEKPNVKLRSLNGPNNTILDGSRNGTVITVNGSHSELDTTNSIEGFTIQNAGYVSFESSPDISWSRDGGGISLKRNANILIKNNIFKDNYNSCGGGGGLYSYESSPVIVNNKFINNVAGISPNGEYCGNWYGGALCLYYGEPIVRNCIFSNNQAQHEGGALYIYNTTDISLENCVFFNNDLIGDYDTGSLLQCNDHGSNSYSLRFMNCIFWESNSDPFSNRYGGVFIEMSYSDYDLSDSDVNYLGGNISVNPLFLDENDFSINDSSPAHNTGNPDSRYNDLDGSRNDMGAYGGQYGIWE